MNFKGQLDSMKILSHFEAINLMAYITFITILLLFMIAWGLSS